MHNVIFIRAKEPGKLRLNEGVFGSYKDKRTEDDKKNIISKETIKILNKKQKELENKFKEYVYSLIDEYIISYTPTVHSVLMLMRNSGAGTSLKLVTNESGDDWFAYDEIFPKTSKYLDKEKLSLPFLTIFNKNGNSLDIDVKIPVNYLESIYLDITLDALFDDNIINFKRFKDVIDKAQSNEILNEELMKWFDVDNINFNIKYHLMKRGEPEKFFNNNILEKVCVIDYTSAIHESKQSVAEHIEEILSLFEWYKIKFKEIVVKTGNDSWTFPAGIYNIYDNIDNMWDDLSKIISTNSMLFNFIKNNNITTLGNYRKMFSKQGSKSVVKGFNQKYGDVTFMFRKEDVSINDDYKHIFGKYKKDYLFTDKLLMELTGYNNITILPKCYIYENNVNNKNLNLFGYSNNTVKEEDKDLYRCVYIHFNAITGGTPIYVAKKRGYYALDKNGQLKDEAKNIFEGAFGYIF